MSEPLRRTALNPVHKQMGAKMVQFGGCEMPVEYSCIVQEHLAVRTRAGLFDVSHMGEIEVRGPEALRLVQQLTCNDASRLAEVRPRESWAFSADVCKRQERVRDIEVELEPLAPPSNPRSGH